VQRWPGRCSTSLDTELDDDAIGACAIEVNLDNHTVYRLLIPVIKDVKKRRQLIMVTHSPNIAVVCDAEQIIHAHIDRANGNRVEYTMGAIEAPELTLHMINVLEGTRPAFDNRGSKYLAS
jgi:hypothetical protein